MVQDTNHDPAAEGEKQVKSKSSTRDLSVESARELGPGDEHYTAFVGPPEQFDFMGATQFRLLSALGLRSGHKLLDLGCGSLRSGRLFIPYLNEGCYYGLEPNKWLVEDAIKNQIGDDIVRIKQPVFLHHEDFSLTEFDTKFDFILAQSIFSHAGPDIINRCFRNFRDSLNEDGLVIATFVECALFKSSFTGSGWVYPDVVAYRRPEIKNFAESTGFCTTQIPWYHPRQHWYLFAKRRELLPSWTMRRHLKGSVLFTPEFRASWGKTARALDYLSRRLPSRIWNWLEKFLVPGSNSLL